MTQFLKIAICITMLLVKSNSMASHDAFLERINKEKAGFFISFNTICKAMVKVADENKKKNFLNAEVKAANVKRATEIIDVIDVIKTKIYDQDGKLKDNDALLREDFTFVEVKHLWLGNSLSNCLHRHLGVFFERGSYQRKLPLKETVYAQGLLNEHKKSLSLRMRSRVSSYLWIPGSLEGEAIVEPVKKFKNSMLYRFSNVSFVNKKDAFGYQNIARLWCLPLIGIRS